MLFVPLRSMFTRALWGVLLKAGPRPSGPRPTARNGPAARRPGGLETRWPSPDFPQFFCPAVNPRAYTDLHRVWACKIDDGEFEFVYHFNNHFNPFRSFLTAGQKNCGKSGLGHRASRPPGRWAVAGREPRAVGLLLAKPRRSSFSRHP